MKKIYLFALSLMACSAVNAQTSLVNDDFESYPVGSYYGGHWKNWVLNEGEDLLNVFVSDVRASSGTKSGYIGPNNGSGQDVFLVMPNTYDNGITTAEWKMYIPDTSFAYYNLQESTTPGTSWGFESYTNFYTDTSLAGKMVWTFTQDTSRYLYASAVVPFNTWFTLKHVINLDENTLDITIDNVPVTYSQSLGNEYPGALKTIGGFNFYSSPGDTTAAVPKVNSYNLDDVSISTTGVTGIGKVKAPQFNVSVYPNPAEAVLTINAEEKISALEVYNVAGQKVYTATPNNNKTTINVRDLAAGIYSVTIRANNKTVVKKFTVK